MICDKVAKIKCLVDKNKKVLELTNTFLMGTNIFFFIANSPQFMS